jgi:predicted RNase H-like HicB family nuclease
MEIQRFVKYKYLSNKKNHNTTMSKPTTFTAVLHKEENMYIAECPEVGTVSQGETIEEAINNLIEATQLYLEEFPLEKGVRSIITTFEVPQGAEA